MPHALIWLSECIIAFTAVVSLIVASVFLVDRSRPGIHTYLLISLFTKISRANSIRCRLNSWIDISEFTVLIWGFHCHWLAILWSIRHIFLSFNLWFNLWKNLFLQGKYLLIWTSFREILSSLIHGKFAWVITKIHFFEKL